MSIDEMSPAELPMAVPVGIHKNEIDLMLFSAWSAGAADISFASGEPAVARIRGDYVNVTKRALQHNELQIIAQILYGENAMSLLGSGRSLDPRYSFLIGRGKRIGFRVNLTQCMVGNMTGGIQITCRSLPGLPMHLSELGVPLQLAKAFFSRQGLVIVAGETGSGKSTLLAGVFRTLLEDARNHKILTYEDPIEYTYGEVNRHPTNFIYQQQIGLDIKSFELAAENLLRRAPTDGLIGEARNRETISGAIEVALTGVKTYTTVHSDTPGGVINRMVQAFPYADHPSITEKLLSQVRLIVVQRLVKRLDGKQAAINCWFINNDETKERLAGVKSEVIGREIDKICRENRTTFEYHAASRVLKNEISIEAAAYACGVLPITIEKIINETDNGHWKFYEPGDFSGSVV